MLRYAIALHGGHRARSKWMRRRRNGVGEEKGRDDGNGSRWLWLESSQVRLHRRGEWRDEVAAQLLQDGSANFAGWRCDRKRRMHRMGWDGAEGTKAKVGAVSLVYCG